MVISGWGVSMAQAQSHAVSGYVFSSDDGEALPGVNVVVQGTTVGTSTNIDGYFQLNAPDENDILVFSYLGYQTQEVPIDGRSEIEVNLEPRAIMGEELVVVGYGTVRQESVTGSVASISGERMAEVPSSNITGALQGRVPGVEFSQTSSQPGASMQIRIRGTRSLTASNDPLVVLNGIPFSGSIGDLNPNNIESIDILKDASATAIYGSRGANGVILITTKSGREGQDPEITYNGYYGAATVFSPYPMMSGQDFVALREAAGQYTNGADESNDVNTDWQDLLYQTGALTSHDIGVTGGTSNGSYTFGGGYHQNKGVIPTQQYNRISLRGSVDQQIGEYFSFGFNSNNNYNLTEGSQVGLYNMLSMSPIASPYNEDGSRRRTIRMPNDENWVSSREVMDDVEDRWVNESRSYATYNALYAEVDIPWVEGLSYRTNFGLDYRQTNNGAFTGSGINSPNPNTESTASVGNNHTYNWVVENIVNYDQQFADVHQVTVTGLFSAEESRYNSSFMSARNIPNEAFQFYNLGQADGEISINPGNQNYQVSGLMSYMGRVMYSYDNRYMLSATLRTDGSSRLADGEKWHTYPAVSVGWNVDREGFMDNVPHLSMLKLRAGYGQTSNQAIAPYSTLGRLGTRPYNHGDDTYVTGFRVTELPNQNLGWEYSETYNYGVDFSLWNDRLFGTVEYYVTNTKDILLGVNLPSTSGVGSYTANIGETQNKGLEVSLNGMIFENPEGWSWEAGLNFYSNRNELVALAGDQERDESNWWFVGNPINVIYDYNNIGIWQEDDPHRDILEPGGNAGMIKVEYTGDYNEDGTPTRAIGPEDRQVLDVNPRFQGGFNSRVTYRNFDFNVIGAFQNGGILISTLHSASGYLNLLSGRRNNVDVDYWTPENTGGNYPAPGGITTGDNPKYGSTMGYFDASYLKIRTMTLGYNLGNTTWMDNAGIRDFRVYFTVQNPFVLFSPFNRETGLDPETNSFGDQNAAVTSAYQPRLLTVGTNAPATRNFLLGINLSF